MEDTNSGSESNLFTAKRVTDCTCTHVLLAKAGFKSEEISGHADRCRLNFTSTIPTTQIISAKKNNDSSEDELDKILDQASKPKLKRDILAWHHQQLEAKDEESFKRGFKDAEGLYKHE